MTDRNCLYKATFTRPLAGDVLGRPPRGPDDKQRQHLCVHWDAAASCRGPQRRTGGSSRGTRTAHRGHGSTRRTPPSPRQWWMYPPAADGRRGGCIRGVGHDNDPSSAILPLQAGRRPSPLPGSTSTRDIDGGRTGRPKASSTPIRTAGGFFTWGQRRDDPCLLSRTF